MKENGKNGIISIIAQRPLWMSLSVLLAILSASAYFVPYIVIYLLIAGLLPGISGSYTVSVAWISRCGLAALLGAAANIICYFGALSASHVGAFDIAFHLRKKFVEHISKISLGEYLTVGSGKMQNLLNENINQIQSYLAHEVPEIIMAVLSPVILLGIMFYINVWYTIALCVGLICAYYFNVKSYSYAAGGGKRMMDIYLSALDDLNNECNEFVRGISVIKIFGQRNQAYKHLNDSIKRYSGSCIPYTLIWEKYRCVFSGMMSNLYLVLLPIVYVLLSGNDVNYDATVDLVIFIVLTPSLAAVIPKAEGISNNLVRVEMAIDRLNSILNMTQMPEVSEDMEKCTTNCIEFQHVGFSYDSRRAALKDVSFVAEEGTITGIVGPSGGGKSTIAYLLARFWDVDQGSIRIGGIDIRQLKTEELMGKIAFVFQDSFLFNQSVADNIRANINADLEDVIKAAKAARCHDFIMALPNGYDTVLGPNQKLSGGQRQRVAIARAMLKNAPIVVLDEVTSFTDPETEYELQLVISELSQNKTVIMIAHRLANVKSADQILFVEKGKIIEVGTHQALIEKGGQYRHMWDIYQENINWKLR